MPNNENKKYLKLTQEDTEFYVPLAKYMEENALPKKQDTLVSGTNIKTINGTSLLGSGNITIEGGGGSVTVDSELSSTSTNPVQNKVINSALNNKQDKIGTLEIHEFESGGIVRNLKLGGHTEDNLHVQDGTLVVDKFSVPSSGEFSVSCPAEFAAPINAKDYISTKGIIQASEYSGFNSDSIVFDATTLSFKTSGYISNVNYISGSGNSFYIFAGDTGGSSFINIRDGVCVKIGDVNSGGYSNISLFGISDPISSPNPSQGIYETDLPYQAVNKAYTDTKLAADTDNYSIAWDSTSEAIKITFHE